MIGCDQSQHNIFAYIRQEGSQTCVIRLLKFRFVEQDSLGNDSCERDGFVKFDLLS